MTEIALYILDLAQNSIAAKATKVTIEVIEDITHNIFSFSIEDNGCGMDKEAIRKATSPYYTTRKTRKVGLGLALIQELCEGCSGTFTIESVLNQGTTIKATMQYDHLDRPELGAMEETLYSIMIQDIDLVYIHRYENNQFHFDLKEIKHILGDVSLLQYDVAHWIKDYITEQLVQIKQPEEV